MALGAIAGGMQLAQGIVNGISSWQQSKQVRANAQVMQGDMINRKNAMLAARLANSKREAQITSAKLANIESMYSVSGIEMKGDIVNYIAEVAAAEELNSQQLTQDAFYTATVMDVQRENMRTAAKQQEKALKISAFTSLFGATAQAGLTYSESASYWEKNGPGVDTGNTPEAGEVQGFLE